MDISRYFRRGVIKNSFVVGGVSADQWISCKSCSNIIRVDSFIKNFNVCPVCGYHSYLSPSLRFSMFFDGGFEKLSFSRVEDDPLNFSDIKSYSDRLSVARKSCSSYDAIESSVGEISSVKSIISVLNFKFIGGSMGTALGSEILSVCKYAVRYRYPVIFCIASGGARMQEGILSLLQMPRTLCGFKLLKDNRIPCINVLTYPTTGGVTASFGMMADITIAEPDSIIGFAGMRVIKDTIGAKFLPDGFQSAEFQLKHGFVDKIVDRKNLKSVVGGILRVFDLRH